MTIGAIIVDIFLGIGAIFLIIMYFSEDQRTLGIIAIVVSFLIMTGIIFFQLWYYGNTAEGSRKIKTQKSELQNGITRTVKVYDMQGDLIQEYKGKFDITYDESRILFDDENNKRHIIYYTTGTVVIDEE